MNRCLLFAWFFAVVICKADDVVFIGSPRIRLHGDEGQPDRQVLSGKQIERNMCKIVMRDGRYFWRHGGLHALSHVP